MVIPHSKHFTAGWRLISDTLENCWVDQLKPELIPGWFILVYTMLFSSETWLIICKFKYFVHFDCMNTTASYKG